jgi:hypothetical protein
MTSKSVYDILPGLPLRSVSYTNRPRVRRESEIELLRASRLGWPQRLGQGVGVAGQGWARNRALSPYTPSKIRTPITRTLLGKSLPGS